MADVRAIAFLYRQQVRQGDGQFREHACQEQRRSLVFVICASSREITLNNGASVHVKESRTRSKMSTGLIGNEIALAM